MSGAQGLFWNPGFAPHLLRPIPVDHNTHSRGESPECLQRDTPLKVIQPFNRLTEHLPCAGTPEILSCLPTALQGSYIPPGKNPNPPMPTGP